MPISVCIVDDHAEIRHVLEQMILRAKGFELAGSCSGFREALVVIPALRPQVVLTDIQLGENKDGIDLVRELRPKHPELLFMMCTVFDDDEKILSALQAGAHGYILKKTAPDRMLEAIRELKEGGSPLSSQVARKLISLLQEAAGSKRKPPPRGFPEKTGPLCDLSERENEILQQLAYGLLYKEIAANLYISQETVRKHVYHIYEKLRVNNRVEAVNKFFRRQ
jgi:DNA-binding NarL/FixJ family response regulator